MGFDGIDGGHDGLFLLGSLLTLASTGRRRCWLGTDHRDPLAVGLDDQDGDPADEPTITVVDDRWLTKDDGWASVAPQAAIYRGFIYLTWKDSRYNQDTPPRDVFYMIVDTAGKVVYPETALTTNSTLDYTHYYADNVINVAIDSIGKAHMAWCDDRDNPSYTEIYYTSYTPLLLKKVNDSSLCLEWKL